jgi:uncharacterized membrane protein YdjX (TVP38/TMEM64 family)
MRRAALLLAVVASAVIAAKLLVENALGVDLGVALTRWATEPGAGAAAVVAGLLAIDVLLPVPSSLVMVASGALFGVGWGAAIALAGSLGGEWLGFEIAKRWGRPAARRLVGDVDFDALTTLMSRHGAPLVAVTRPLPIAMETFSVIAGLAGMPRATFLGASLLGTAPIVVIYAWAGAHSRQTGNLVPAIVIVTALGAAGWWWSRRARGGA